MFITVFRMSSLGSKRVRAIFSLVTAHRPSPSPFGSAGADRSIDDLNFPGGRTPHRKVT